MDAIADCRAVQAVVLIASLMALFDASVANLRGLDPATVQTLLAQSKITTAERYLHARPLNELAERMDAIFGLSPAAEDR